MSSDFQPQVSVQSLWQVIRFFFFPTPYYCIHDQTNTLQKQCLKYVHYSHMHAHKVTDFSTVLKHDLWLFDDTFNKGLLGKNHLGNIVC